MMKLWMAPAGLHVEPAQIRDADDLARIHKQGFYPRLAARGIRRRSWPKHPPRPISPATPSAA